MSISKRVGGFTIIELLVVITVISILVGITVVSYSALQVRSRDTERQADIDTMAAALEGYYDKNGKYPDLNTFVGATFFSDDLRVPPSALTSPSSTNAAAPYYSYVWGATSGPGVYGIISYTDTAGTQCTAASQTCTRFVLSYTKEQDNSVSNKISKYGN